MSLPPAQKSVSETPAKMGVTEPHKSTQSTDKDVEKSVCIMPLLSPGLFSPILTLYLYLHSPSLPPPPPLS